MVVLRRAGDDGACLLPRPAKASNEPPFLRGQVSPAQDRRPGSSPRRGITVAGQRRFLTGFAVPAPPRPAPEHGYSTAPAPGCHTRGSGGDGPGEGRHAGARHGPWRDQGPDTAIAVTTS